jgi:amino acid adenylation domain-containing protein
LPVAADQTHLSTADTTERIESPKIAVEQNNDIVRKSPLSFSQQRLWFLDQLEPQNSVYNICKAQRIKGQLNLRALEGSLVAIATRHEILRTSFPTIDGEPVQLIHADARLSLQRVDLSHLPLAQKQAESERIITEEARIGFDLSRDPLFRARFLVLSEEEVVWLFTVHQMIWDGWSFRIFYRELTSFYDSFPSGKTAAVPELPLQFGDYAVQQRQQFQGDRLQNDLSFWRQRLSRSSQHLSLLADHPRLHRQSYRGARRPVALRETLTHDLKKLSQRQGATLFMTLMAAFTTLLHRYSGEVEIVLGCPVANRHRPEIENLIGSFVNTLVLNINVTGSSSFIELLAGVRTSCLAAFAHQELPFEKLVEELQPERSLNHNPLFQTFFAFQQTPLPVLTLPGLSSESLEVSSNSSKFDLTLSLAEYNHTLVGFFEYSTDLFEPTTIDRMSEHYWRLLEGIVADPDCPIAMLPLLSRAERQQLLIEWNDTEAEYVKDKCISQLFEDQAARIPEVIAVVFEEQELTYRDLNRRANQLASYLINLGIGAGKLVGIWLERSVEMVVSLLGVLKAGATYVPLHPSDPAERLRFMVEDAQLSFVLTTEQLIEDRGWKIENDKSQSSLFASEVKIVCLDRNTAVFEEQIAENPAAKPSAEGIAYVIYTSGSTGEPKGVQVSHRSVINCLQSIRERLGFGERDVLLAVTPISFDISVLELFLPLLVGAKVVVASRKEVTDGRELACRLKICSATALQATPPTWRLLIEAGWKGFPGFRILCGGESMPRDLAEALLIRGEVWNLYGPTECTIWSMVCKVDSGEGPVPIGRPIANTKLYILDSHLQPVPIGVRGEICIGGVGVAFGYCNQAELTAEKFIANPFVVGERLYRTGDQGRLRADGNIEFIGRLDHQVKIRGHRVELGEIEAALNQYPAVRESLVLVSDNQEPAIAEARKAQTPTEGNGGIEDQKPAHGLVAYLVVNEKHPPLSDLRDFLTKKLPQYMIPSAFVTLESFPLTSSGKIDRRLLPPADSARRQLGHGFMESRTEFEELITQVWKEVLKLDKIAVNSSFFELGGHSLLAVKVISRITDLFHTDLPLRTLFQTPTIAGLARAVETARQVKLQMARPPIFLTSHGTPLRPSLAQEPVLHLARHFPGASCFNIPAVYRLKGMLDVNALQRSLTAVVERHEALRTTFPTLSGQQVQFIGNSSSIRLEIMDFEELPELQREAAVKRVVRDEAETSFDLAVEPLLRVKLLRLDVTTHVLTVTMHHIIGDGWSMNIFFRDLSECYRADVNGQDASLPELPIQYSDFSEWQRQQLDCHWLRSQLHYWEGQLESPLRRLEIPPGHFPSDELGFLMARKSLSITGDMFESVKRLSQTEEITPFMTLLTALNILLYCCTGQEVLRVGTLVANRGLKETENLIGHFVNSLILRTQLSADSNFRQLAKQVRDTALAAYMNQDFPFETLVRRLESERNLDRASLCQVMFIYQTLPPCGLELPGLAVDLLEEINTIDGVDLPITTFDLIFLFKEKRGGLLGSLTYKVELFGEAVIDRMIAHFDTILRSITTTPLQPVSELCSLQDPGR